MKKGFSLVELLTTTVIIAILSAVAIPAYNQYIIRTSDQICENVATAVLTSLVSYEKFTGGIQNGSYTDINQLNSLLGEYRFGSIPAGFELLVVVDGAAGTSKNIQVFVFDREYMGEADIQI